MLQKAYRKGIEYGAIAGLVATWSISTAIAASEVELGLPISTFYSVMGMSLGYGDFGAAAYLGFALHLVTGTALGAAIWLVSTKWIKGVVINPYKATLVGIGTGMVVWLVLFLPVTVLLVQPSLERVALTAPFQAAALENKVWGIAVSAIVFHMVWGAIFGYISSSLTRIRALRIAELEHGGRM
jgi:hypothetical protein